MVRYRRWLVVWSSLWLVLGLLVVPGAAWGEADAGRGVKGPVVEVATPEVPVKCSLVPSDSPDHEFASCLRVDATLDRALSVGETGTLTVGVFSQVSAAGTVTVDVPAGLVVVSGPGFSEGLERALSGFGEMRPRVVGVELVADESVSFTLKVEAVAGGPASIEVRATADVGSFGDGAMDTVYVTIGDGSRAATLSVEVPAEGGVTAVFDAPVGPVPVDEFEAAPPVVVDAVNDDGVGVDPSAPESCVIGRWGYQHPTNGYTGVPNYTVQAWDVDTFSGDDYLAGDVTDGSGNFNLCWTDADGEFEGPDAQEVYVKFRSENVMWRVHDASQTVYNNTTATVSVSAGTDHDFGTMEPANNVHRGIHAYHLANNLWQWGSDPNSPYCFDWDETSCRQMMIEWYVGSTTGNFYSGNTIYIVESGPDDEFMVLHEGGHAIMDDAYNDSMPPAPNCNPHWPGTASSLGCAWAEGFASWVAVAAIDSPTHPWSNQYERLTWTWPSAWSDGPEDEGRVTGAMVDIGDSSVAPDDHWDEWSESEIVQLEVFQDWALYGDGVRPATYEEFWTDRTQAGLDVISANACNYQNTIDFSFRDRLSAYAEKTRPTPLEDDHRYLALNTSTLNQGYWSAVAIRPPAAADFDLAYYGDFDQTDLLALSIWAGTAVDVIAVDNNHRPFGEFGLWDYPRVNRHSGTGEYLIEWAAGKVTLGSSQSVSLTAADVAVVRDSWHYGGEKVYYRAVPAAAMDVGILLFDSDPGTTGTLVQGRSSALASSFEAGAGEPEAFIATTAANDWLGFVMINDNGVAGSVDLYRDTSAPVGSVTIAGGAGVTSSPSVTLSLSASDPQTGVVDMRVSTDGVFDTEPWESFSSSKAVTLPGSFGTKTVQVEFRNNAGMVTSTSDSIMYTGGPATDSEWLVIDGVDHVAGLFTDPGTRATWVDVRRVSNGVLVSSVEFGSTYPGSDLEILDRGVGAPELVVLGTDVRGAVRATARDAVTGSLVARANYGSTYSGDDLETVGLNKLAVLGTNPGNDNVRVQTRNLSDLLVGNAFLGNAFSGDDLEVFGSNVAVLGTKYANDNVRVRVVDPAAGTTLGNSYFGTAFVGVDLEVMGSNLAVLQQRLSDGNVRTQVRTLAGTKVATVGFGTAYTGDVLRVVGSDVAVGGTKPSNGAVRVQTRTLAGSVVGTAQFGTGYSCLDFETVGGDVAVFGVKSTGKIRDQIRTTTGTVVATLYYN